MEKALLHSHSGTRYIVIALAIAAIANALGGLLGKRKFNAIGANLGKFFVLSTHLQALIGLVMYFGVYKYYKLFSDMAGTMANADLRWKAVEHLVTMLIAVVLITIGNAKSKRATTDAKKYQHQLVFFILGIVIIFLGIPANRWF